MRATWARRASCAALALAAALAAGGAKADEPPQSPPQPPSLATSARARYEAGSEAFGAKRFAEAALHFEAAATLQPHAASWFMASLAWGEAFRPDRAADALVRCLAADAGLDDKLKARAKAQLLALELSIGTLDVQAPAGWRVSLDSGIEMLTPARLHALPGVRALRIVPPGMKAFDREEALQAGVTRRLVLGEEDAARAEALRTTRAPEVRIVERTIVKTEAQRPNVLRTVGIGALGFAVASLGAAALLGASALDAREAYRTSRTERAYDHVRMLQAWTNVAWAATGVFAAGGVTLLAWPALAPSAPAPAPTSQGGGVFATYRGAF